MDPEYPAELPANPFLDALPRQAYAHCLAFEAEPDVEKPSLPNLISARFLGHLLHRLDITECLGGVDTLSEAISSAASAGNDAMTELAQQYITFLVKTFKRPSGTPNRTPWPSSHSSEDSEDRCETYLDMMESGRLDHLAAKKFALSRDKYRCAVTGTPDMRSCMNEVVIPQKNETAHPTQAAHILPETLNTNIGPGNSKPYSRAGFWDMIACFTQDPHFREEFQGNKIHRLDNIMTLALNIHHMFNCLELWFKPVDQAPVPNTYRTHGAHPWTAGADCTVTFAFTEELPAPNPTLLALHALACEVAHLSGAARYLHKLQDAVEEKHHLAHDGSSAQLLASVLALVAPVLPDA